MCLLVVLFRVHRDAPLIVAANRDEDLSRPAIAMTTLRASTPRVLGGRDVLAGGTWLAVNEHGVVAGLTNVPFSRDPARRSRGELPLLASRHRGAEAAAGELSRIAPSTFSPCWILAGDRRTLYYVDLAGGGSAVARELEPGLHVLENRPLFAASPKAEHVRREEAALLRATGSGLLDALFGVLKSHEIPGAPSSDPEARGRPREAEAACVHGRGYGTRSSAIVMVPELGTPRVWSSDGPPCTSALTDVSPMWTDGSG